VIGDAQFGKVALGRASHLRVDIHLDHGLDVWMLEHFPQGAAVAATDDQHPFRFGVGE